MKNKKWVFLSKTRRWCLSITLIAYLLLIIQTTFGKYEEIANFVWIIFLFLTIPLIILLWINRRNNKFSGRILSPNIHRLLLFFTIVYFLLILLSILGLPARIARGVSIVEHYLNTITFLTPFEIVLFIFYWLIFYKGKFQVIPDQKIVKDYIKNKARENEKIQKINFQVDFKRKCFDLIASNEIKEALNLMLEYYENESKEKLKYSILLSRQFTENHSQLTSGLLNYSDGQVIFNRLSLAILELIEE